MKRSNVIVPASFTVFLMAFSLALQADTSSLEVDASDAEMEEAGKPTFSELDTDRDGVLTPEEATDTWLESAFASVDSNQDGVVDQNEYYKAA
ncbi:MAG: EF-hand domain-containing protein [Pseudomonadota bacterium]